MIDRRTTTLLKLANVIAGLAVLAMLIPHAGNLVRQLNGVRIAIDFAGGPPHQAGFDAKSQRSR